MSNHLLFVSQVGVLEGLAYTELRKSGDDVFVFNTTTWKFLTPDIGVPSWLNSFAPMAASRWIDDFCKVNSISDYLAVGMDAAAAVIDKLPFKCLSVIAKNGELDYSRKRKHLVSRMARVTVSAKALILCDTHEMTKATLRRAECPIFLWDYTSAIGRLPETKNVPFNLAIVYGSVRGETPQTLEDVGLSAFAELLDIDSSIVDFIPVNEAFWHRDIVSGHSIDRMIARRFSRYTHYIFVDSDIESAALAKILSCWGATVLILPSVASLLASIDTPSIRVSSQLKMVSEMKSISSSDRVFFDFIYEGSGEGSGSTLSRIARISEELPDSMWWYEDYGVVSEVCVFVSVAAIEDRSNGARPQRIRNMFAALQALAPTLVIHFDDFSSNRRILALKHLLSQGIRIKKLYGENSTTPVMSSSTVLDIANGLSSLIPKDNSGSWFVRDLHWLDRDIEISSDLSNHELVNAGRIELEEMASVFGNVTGPSCESNLMFDGLINGKWNFSGFQGELPPGVAQPNTVELSQISPEDDRATFLYSGGLNSTYNLDSFFDALKRLRDESPNQFYADFIVREEEAIELYDALVIRGIEEAPEIRVQFGSLEDYVPRSRNLVGVMVLESTYGTSSFPFKSVSYLELGIPILCFIDSPVHRKFGGYGVTIPVSSGDSSAVYEKMKLSLSRTFIGTDAFRRIWENEDWGSRLRESDFISDVSTSPVIYK